MAGVVCLVGLAWLAHAAPSVENVAVADDGLSRGVTVTYDLLGAPAVITVSLLTNGVPLDAAHTLAGDVARVVPTGTAHKVVWRSDLDLGETNAAPCALSARVRAWATNAPPDYFVLDLDDARRRRRFYEREEQLPGGITSDVYRTSKMVFRRIPSAGASFAMGAPSAEWSATGLSGGSLYGLETQHDVTLSKDYYLGVFEVTQGQWQRVCGSLPTQGYTGSGRDTHPVENVGWTTHVRANETQMGGKWPGSAGRHPQSTHFLGKLRLLAGGVAVVAQGSYSGVQGTGYDLPTEAQWEFACRAGTATAFNNGLDLASAASVAGLEAVCWYAANAGGGTHRVGELQANAWGLYDMHGNVAEWCLDNVEPGNQASQWYASARTDPEGPTLTASRRAARGGGFPDLARACRSAGSRQANVGSSKTEYPEATTSRGFRVACPVDEL